MIAVEAPGWQGARREHTRRYVTDEQRRQPGRIAREGERAVSAHALRAQRFALLMLARDASSPV